MKIVESSELDQKKWDVLVEKQGGMCYLKSWYLNATAKNWCVLIDETYTKGIALAYNKALGKSILYPAIFGRTSAFLGFKESEFQTALELIQRHFTIGSLQLELKLDHPSINQRSFQQIVERKPLNQLAKRMLSKAKKAGVELLPTDYRSVLPFVKQELGQKIKELDAANLNRLDDLLCSLQERGVLISSGIYFHQELMGGLFFIKDGNRILYLQGAATEELKKLGGMYLAMNQEIELALQAQKKLDFGGSDLEGVRRFFKALGGEDVFYYAYNWDHAPFWFRAIRKINKLFK